MNRVKRVKVNKEKEYLIGYNFDGRGTAYITAKNEEEAKEKFYNGGYEDSDEDGENYEVYNIEEVN